MYVDYLMKKIKYPLTSENKSHHIKYITFKTLRKLKFSLITSVLFIIFDYIILL
jgi:hypothetical protein